jgi:quinohemoprotein amine dehydrogenase
MTADKKPPINKRDTFMRKTLFTLMGMLLLLGIAVPGAMAFSKESLTYQKCTECHAVKDGKISRVEEIRTTPEEWAVIVDRMARLYGMSLTAAEMDVLLKELTDTQILTPEEANKVSYLNLYHNSQVVELPEPGQEQLFEACVRCHSYGKIHSYRMTPSEWDKVLDLHLYTTPTTPYQLRAMKWIDEAKVVLAQLAESLPYGQAWKKPTAVPVGSWMILGYEPGKGNYRGQASIQNAAGGDYRVVGNLVFTDGTRENFQGEATLYGGYALRTRTSHDGFKTLGAFAFVDGIIKGEHHFPAPDYRTSTSTWYPVTRTPQVLRVSPGYALRGETTTLTIEGLNLPQVKAADFSVRGGSLQVLSARRVAAEVVEVDVVYQGSDFNQVQISLKGLDAGTLTLAPQIDYIAINPPLGRARVDGGKNFPPQGVQFEAVAYSHAGKAADSDDHVALGPVPATFTLSEYETRPNDDDLVWMGAILPHGAYLPIGSYHPITAREYKAEGTGLVKVEAQYKRGDKSYAAEAQLAVTVPDFIPRIR